MSTVQTLYLDKPVKKTTTCKFATLLVPVLKFSECVLKIYYYYNNNNIAFFPKQVGVG